MFFSFRLAVETTQTKDVMGRFFQRSSFSNPVHRTGVSLLTTKSETDASDPNPFTALFDFSDWSGSDWGDARHNADTLLKHDSEIEEIVRSQALLDARRRCHEFYTRCKQSLRMPCF
jgi:hypothetical protein